MFAVRKICRALFSGNIRFELCSFVLLPKTFNILLKFKYLMVLELFYLLMGCEKLINCLC